MAWANAVNATQTGVQTINAGVWTGSTLTQHNLLIGGASSALTSVAPSATAGVAFVSTGATSDPAPGTVVVAGGGTGLTSITSHNLLIGAGTSTTLLAPSSTAGIPLISAGSSADPAYGTAVVAGGGTGVASLTSYAVLAGGTTSTGAIQQVSGVGTSGQILTSNGAAALPSWQDPSASSTWTDLGTPGSLSSGANYFITASGAYTLPASPAQGDSIALICVATSGVAITGNTGQIIQIGSSSSTSAGTATSGSLGDSLHLVYRAADTTWYNEDGAQGNWVTA